MNSSEQLEVSGQKRNGGVVPSSGDSASAAALSAAAALSESSRVILNLPKHYPRLLSPTNAAMNASKRQRLQQQDDEEIVLAETELQQQDHLADTPGTGEEDHEDDDDEEDCVESAESITNRHQNDLHLHSRDTMLSTGSGRRMRLTLGQKREVVDLAASKKFTHRELAQKFRVGRTTITNICRQEELIRNETDSADASKKKRKTTKCSYDLRILDECLHKWRMEVKVSSPDTKLTGNVLQQKALELASKLLQEPLADIPDKVRTALQKFSASNGWLDGYRTRFGSFSSKQALAEPNVIKNVDMQTRLREIHLALSQVDSQDIWTIGEFALQYGSSVSHFASHLVSSLTTSSNGILPSHPGAASMSMPGAGSATNSVATLDPTFGTDWNDAASLNGGGHASAATVGTSGNGCYTVGLVVSAQGETFDMQVIGTETHPLQLENVDLQRGYRIIYGHSKTGWQVSHTMVSLLKRLNGLAKSRKRIFRVIMDSAVPHVKAAILLDSQGDQRTLFVYDHLQLFFLPPNFKLFRCHPCHLGIISSFKARFRYEMLETLFAAYQQQLQVLQQDKFTGTGVGGTNPASTDSDVSPANYAAYSAPGDPATSSHPAQSESEALAALTQVLRMVKPRNVFHWLHIALESVSKSLLQTAWVNSGLLPARLAASLTTTNLVLTKSGNSLTPRMTSQHTTNAPTAAVNSLSIDLGEGVHDIKPISVRPTMADGTDSSATSAFVNRQESAWVAYETNCFRDLQRLLDDVLQHAPELLNALGIAIANAHQLVEMEGNAAVTDPGIDEVQILRSVLQKHGYWAATRPTASAAAASDAFMMSGTSTDPTSTAPNDPNAMDLATRPPASSSSTSLTQGFLNEEHCPATSQVHQSILVLKQFLRTTNDPIENRIDAIVQLNQLRSFLPSNTISM